MNRCIASLALLAVFVVPPQAQASHSTNFGTIDAIDNVFGPGGGTFNGTLAPVAEDDAWIAFSAQAGDVLNIVFSTQVNFMDAAMFREVTNGVVEAGDVANVTDFNFDRTGAGQDLVVQHGGFGVGNNYVFGTSAGQTPETLNFNVSDSGEYVIGISLNNEDTSRAGNFTVQLNIVPEPSTLALFSFSGLGLLGLDWHRRKRA